MLCGVMHTESESVLQFLQGLLVTMVSVVSQVRVLRHAGLGRPAGHADTPSISALDDQQSMLRSLERKYVPHHVLALWLVPLR